VVAVVAGATLVLTRARASSSPSASAAGAPTGSFQELLAYVPDSPDVRGTAIRFNDITRIRTAFGIAGPADVNDWKAWNHYLTALGGEGDGDTRWPGIEASYASGMGSGCQRCNTPTAPLGVTWPAAYGFLPTSVTREVSAGMLPARISVLGGTFDPAAVADAFQRDQPKGSSSSTVGASTIIVSNCPENERCHDSTIRALLGREPAAAVSTTAVVIGNVASVVRASIDVSMGARGLAADAQVSDLVALLDREGVYTGAVVTDPATQLHTELTTPGTAPPLGRFTALAVGYRAVDGKPEGLVVIDGARDAQAEATLLQHFFESTVDPGTGELLADKLRVAGVRTEGTATVVTIDVSRDHTGLLMHLIDVRAFPAPGP